MIPYTCSMQLWRTMVCFALVACMGLHAGCRTRQFETEGDALRAQVLDLQDQVRDLERRERELLAELRRARAWAERREELADEDVRAFVPHVVDIQIGRLSHVRDRQGDGFGDTLVLYVQPIDSRGRFTQMVGNVIVNLAVVPDEVDPIPLGRLRFGPGDVRDAFRSGITGTHYSFEVPLDIPAKVDLDWLLTQQVVARATFVDGQTGDRHTTERVIAMQR